MMQARILPHSLTNFEIQNKPRFNGVFSRNTSRKIKNGAHVIHLDEYKSSGTDWVALYVNEQPTLTAFGVKKILEEIKKLIGSKNLITNIYRMQASDLIMRKYFCIEFIDLILICNSLWLCKFNFS